MLPQAEGSDFLALLRRDGQPATAATLDCFGQDACAIDMLTTKVSGFRCRYCVTCAAAVMECIQHTATTHIQILRPHGCVEAQQMNNRPAPVCTMRHSPPRTALATHAH